MTGRRLSQPYLTRNQHRVAALRRQNTEGNIHHRRQNTEGNIHHSPLAVSILSKVRARSKTIENNFNSQYYKNYTLGIKP